jgi:hypothetical protein
MEGEVATTDKLSGKVFSVPAGQKASRLEGKLALSDLSDDEKERLLNKMEKNVKRLEHLADKQAQKPTKLEKAVGKKSGKAETTLQKADESKKVISNKRAEKQNKGKDTSMTGNDDTGTASDSKEKINKKPEITGIAAQSKNGKKD